jgi:nucleoside-diphosphate-sugar epimerase
VDDPQALCGTIRPTHLLHLAWYVNPTDYKTSPKNGRWREASLRLLSSFLNAGGKRAVGAGTNMEYDWHSGADFLNERTSRLSDVNAYAKSKQETWSEWQRIAKETRASVAWARVFHIYGPFESPTRLVPKIINASLRGESPVIDSANPLLDYTYIEDVARAFAEVLDSPAEGALNIGSGSGATPHEIAILVSKLLGSEPVTTVHPGNSQFRVVADITRITDETGWKPRDGLEEGLKKTIEWWKHRRDQ